MVEETPARGIRRRSDKLRIIGWANLLVCVAVGLFADFGDAAMRWTAAAVWSLALLGVCYGRARQMDREGPVRRREGS